jgi:hypothetical protein
VTLGVIVRVRNSFLAFIKGIFTLAGVCHPGVEKPSKLPILNIIVIRGVCEYETSCTVLQQLPLGASGNDKCPSY